jgi:hypothetical protein
VRFVDDFSLDTTTEDFRVIIINAISEVLHVLLRLMLEFRVAEHVADLLEVIRGFQPNESITSALVIIESAGTIFIITTFLTPA